MFKRTDLSAGWARWFGRLHRSISDETTRLDIPGIGQLVIAGQPDQDPFIFGRLRTGAMFEPHILAAITALTPPDAVFLDVGANIGLFTLCASRLVGAGGAVVAIEPEVTNIRLLRRNVQQNSASNVRIIAAAAGDRRGSARLSPSPENAGDHRVGSLSRIGGSRVPVMRLDSLPLPPAKPLVIKLDIQGSEVAALRGAAGLLQSAVPVRVIVEFWPHGLEDCGTTATALIELLDTHFSRFWLLWSHCGPQSATLDELRDRAATNLAPATRMFADVVALRASDMPAIIAMEALAAAA